MKSVKRGVSRQGQEVAIEVDERLRRVGELFRLFSDMFREMATISDRLAQEAERKRDHRMAEGSGEGAPKRASGSGTRQGPITET